MSHPQRSLPMLALAALGAAAAGQTVIQSISPSPGSQWYGTSVAPVGDANGDGYEDFAVGDPQEPLAGAAYAPGGVYIYSGLSGAVIHHHQIGASSTHQQNYGRAVCGLGDVNGDGRADFAVAANKLGSDFRGRVYVRSGATASTIWLFDGTVPGMGQGLGRYVDDIGDLDGDGIHDLFVGGTAATIPEQCQAHVLSGATGLPIHTWTGGRAGARAGDVDADGYQDVLIMRDLAPGTNPVVEVVVKSGATGATLHAISPLTLHGNYAAPFVPRYLSAAGDVNADGHDDFLIGSLLAPLGNQARIQVRSGLTGAILYEPPPVAVSGATLGRDCAPVGDVNGDGYDDFAVIYPGYGLALLSGPGGAVLDAFAMPVPFALEASPCTDRVFATSTEIAAGPRLWVLTWTGGQPNSARSRLEINGVGGGTCSGPFTVALTSGGALTLDWSGSPDVPLILVAGTANPHHAWYPCVGMADVGTPPSYADLAVIFDGTQPGFPNALFRTGAGGTAQQVFPVPLLPPGPLATVQGVVFQAASAACPAVLTASFTFVVN